MKKVSVAICTVNRTSDLVPTIKSLISQDIQEIEVESLIINNGHHDLSSLHEFATASAVNHSLTVIKEKTKGLDNARNRAISEFTGDILFFTDDDVVLAPDWISSTLKVFKKTNADAVCGGIRLAPHLIKSWFTYTHRWMLTETNHKKGPRLTGGNMAIKRHVFDKIQQFDPELDAGSRTGLGGDSLFSDQMIEDGFLIAINDRSTIEHNPDPSRINRKGFLSHAIKYGRSKAYVDWHWLHATPSDDINLKIRDAKNKLNRWRLMHPHLLIRSQFCSKKEILLVSELSYLTALASESQSIRNYEKKGVERLY